MVFLAVFDYRHLERQANLRGGQPHSGRSAHGLAHVLDQFLYFFAPDFLWGNRTRLLPENRVSGMNDW